MSEDEAPIAPVRRGVSAALMSGSSSGSESDGPAREATSETESEDDDERPLAARGGPRRTGSGARRSSSTAARARSPKGKAKSPARRAPSAAKKREPPKKAAAAKRGPAEAKRGAAKRVKAEPSDDEAFERGDARKHFKEGQTKICPPMGDGARAFYETTLQENPSSLISIRWCIERGCLMGTQQKEVLARYRELREAGAYKLPAGGVKPQFAKGLDSKGASGKCDREEAPLKKERRR